MDDIFDRLLILASYIGRRFIHYVGQFFRLNISLSHRYTMPLIFKCFVSVYSFLLCFSSVQSNMIFLLI